MKKSIKIDIPVFYKKQTLYFDILFEELLLKPVVRSVKGVSVCAVCENALTANRFVNNKILK